MASNPNTLTAGIQEIWDKVYQIQFYKTPVFRSFAEVGVAELLQVGDTLHRQYISDLYVKDLDGDGGYNRQTLTDTDETLTIDKAKEISFYLKKLDEIQNHLPVRVKYAREAMNRLWLHIDGVCLGEYDQAASDVDDSDINNRTAGDGFTVNSSNVHTMFIKALEKLQKQNVIIDTSARFTGIVKQDKKSIGRATAIISPEVHSALLEYLGGKDSALGDKVSVNGHVGHFMGFNVHVSNNTAWSATLTMATNPTNNDTITINTVVWTYKTSLSGGSAEGEILIGASAAATVDNTVAAINAASGDTSTYEEVSTANRNLLTDIVATDGTTEITLKATGWGNVVVSETLTASADVWTPAKQIQHNFFTVNNSVALAVQRTPQLLIKDRDGKIGKDVVTWAVYGKKTFNDQTNMIVDVNVRASAFTAPAF